MEVIGIIATIVIGLVAWGFIGASVAHITSYRRKYEKDSFGQVFGKMVQPIVLFLLIYGTTYLIRGESGLLIGAVAGVIPFTMNYRTTVQQRRAKYHALAEETSEDATV